jgi:hypothetical protein
MWDTDNATAGYASAKDLAIHLAPYESRVLIFSDTPPSSNQELHAAGPGGTVNISTAWKVEFTGINKSVAEPELKDWITDPSTIHYSGEAIYSRDVSLESVPPAPVFLEVAGGKALPGAPNSPPEDPVPGPDGLPNPLITRTGPGMRAYYDPPIREAALIAKYGDRFQMQDLNQVKPISSGLLGTVRLVTAESK